MNLVLVDHNTLALEQLKAQALTLGWQKVIACGSGFEAIQAVRRAPDQIGLVMCDLHLPGFDGVEVLRHLAGLDFKGRIAIVCNGDDGVCQRALTLAQAHRLNLVAALRKPVSIDMLAAALRAGHVPRSQDALHAPRGPEALWLAMQRGEIVNEYQPKVSVRTGLVVGMSALVRWQHPTEGLLHAEDFVAIAEDSGLSEGLTSVVLEQAMQHARGWRDRGLGLTLAVKVSNSNLMDPTFPDTLEERARAHGVPLDSLMLEVPDSGSTPHPVGWDEAIRTKNLGLSLDNFGTGQSPLAQLRECAFDELKIDGCFIRGVSRSPGLRAIFDASCAMARHLDMRVVAQSVEDEADWDVLRGSTCDYAQGSFLSAPMPGEDVAAWIADWRAPV